MRASLCSKPSLMSEEFLACWSRGNWGESAKLTKSEVAGQAGRGGGGGACSQIAEKFEGELLIPGPYESWR